MAKLKLKNLSNIGDVLTCEELKHIYGGEVGSGSKCACSWDKSSKKCKPNNLCPVGTTCMDGGENPTNPSIHFCITVYPKTK